MTIAEMLDRAFLEPADVRAERRAALWIRMEHVELKQEARDRVEEREPIELGAIDLGGEGG